MTTTLPIRSSVTRAMAAAAGAWHRRAVAVIVAIVVTTAYIVYAAWQWKQFVVRSWDLGIFTQLLQRYARGEPPIVDIKGDGYNLLGDHFHPLLAALAPVFALFPHAFTLLVIQALCFGVSAGMFTAVATRRLRSRAAGVCLGLAFGFSWGLQYAAEAQFHEIAVGVLLLTGAMCAILDQRWRPAVLWAAPLVFVKEDLGLTVVVIGFLLARACGSLRLLWLSAWGAGWFVVATLVVLPALNPEGQWAYAHSADPLSLLLHLDTFFAPEKGHTLLLVLVAGAGLVFFSPLALLVVPTLAWRFLSTNEGYWGPTWHYSAVLMPIVFAVVLDGTLRGRASTTTWLRRYATHTVAISATIGLMLLPQLPLAGLLTPGSWTPTERSAAAHEILSRVPAGVSVESDIGLMSYLVDDHAVYWIGNDNPAPDCLLIDTVGGGTPREWGDVLSVAARLHSGITYAVRAETNGYELACR